MHTPLPHWPAACPTQGARQNSPEPPSPQGADASQAFGRELKALPDELFDHHHLISRCQAPAFTQDRFAATIAPWLDKFDAQLTKLLERCYEQEAFSCLARAAVGTQLCKATRLQLAECEAIAEMGGVMVRESPGRYELLAPATTPNSEELHVASEGEPPGGHRAKGRLAPDQKSFVRIRKTGANVYRQCPDGSGWCAEARLDHADRIYFAHWSPDSQQLFTLSTSAAKVWARGPDNRWKAVITTAPARQATAFCSHFSPDSRTFLLHHNAGTDVWWRNEDGSWTPDRLLDRPATPVTEMTFSQDSCTMAVLSPESRQDLARILIWSRTQQGEWQKQGSLAVCPQPGPCPRAGLEPAAQISSPHSRFLIALPGNQTLPDQIERGA